MGELVIGFQNTNKGKREYKTQACPHCQAVIDSKKWQEDGGIFFCSRCNKPLCHTCSSTDHKLLKCDTWEQKVLRAVKEADEIAKIGGWA